MASIIPPSVLPAPVMGVWIKQIPALFVGTDAPALWVHDASDPTNSFLIARSPWHAVKWLHTALPENALQQIIDANSAFQHDSPAMPSNPSSSSSPIPTDYGPLSDVDIDTNTLEGGEMQDAVQGISQLRSPCAAQSGSKRRSASPSRTTPACQRGNYMVTTMTSNNRRAETKRRKMREAELAETFITAADDKLHQDFIRTRGKELAWLSKQETMFHLRIEYAEALIFRAAAIGSWDAIRGVKTLFAQWRVTGALDVNRLSSLDKRNHTQSPYQDFDSCIKGLEGAFLNVFHIERAGVVTDLLHRHFYAHLGAIYQQADALAEDMPSHLRGPGIGRQTRIMKALWARMHTLPAFAALPSTASSQSGEQLSSIQASQSLVEPSARDWGKFKKHLAKAKRWLRVQDELGAGVFALIPSHVISHTWIERTLSEERLGIWLQLVARFYPHAVRFGSFIESYIEDGLHGRPAPASQLPIELLEEEEVEGGLGVLLDRLEATPRPDV